MKHASSWQFLSACGSSGPLRVGVGPRDGAPAEYVSFDHPFLMIGRAPGSDLLLDHWQVSRRHAYLQLIEGRYYCVDLGSRTGTHGGDATERSGWLDQDRAIQIGPYSVHPERAESDDFEARPVPGVTWELPGRAIGHSIWKMDRPLVLIGRSPACRIRVVQPDISKFHCSLVLTPTGVWVVDLMGQNGVLVNEVPVRFARLGDGDELRLGRHTFRPRYEDELPELALTAPPDEEEDSGELAQIADVRPSMMPSPGTGLAWPTEGTGLSVPGGIGDPTVSLLVQQFGMMQQQMFDQFHNAMMMMFEGFAAIHREQTDSLREEIDRVRDLSREIETLRVETARLAEAARRPEPVKQPEPARQPERPKATLNGHREGPPLPGKEGKPADPPRRMTPDAPDPEADIHSQLCLRLASIQTERQNRWQKILGMMSSRH
ncbi:FHA domain-containing protein (plasmid) [Tundrisphaera lichenicola]|uniref:FHA domain-containing protein n=1 Tax=Tundrisphaera lichenicola TaxID=2029860 RepID=UPI003EBF8B1A